MSFFNLSAQAFVNAFANFLGMSSMSHLILGQKCRQVHRHRVTLPGTDAEHSRSPQGWAVRAAGVFPGCGSAELSAGALAFRLWLRACRIVLCLSESPIAGLIWWKSCLSWVRDSLSLLPFIRVYWFTVLVELCHLAPLHVNSHPSGCSPVLVNHSYLQQCMAPPRYTILFFT